MQSPCLGHEMLLYNQTKWKKKWKRNDILEFSKPKPQYYYGCILILTTWRFLMCIQCMTHGCFCISPLSKCSCYDQNLIPRPQVSQRNAKATAPPPCVAKLDCCLHVLFRHNTTWRQTHGWHSDSVCTVLSNRQHMLTAIMYHQLAHTKDMQNITWNSYMKEQTNNGDFSKERYAA